jgi:hypothetical protein
MKVFFYPLLPDLRRSIAVWKVSGLPSFVLLGKGNVVMEDDYGALVQ